MSKLREERRAGHFATVEGLPPASSGGIAIPPPGVPPGAPLSPAAQLAAYALAQTYRVYSDSRNRRAAQCHGCGCKLAFDTGHEVYKQGWYAGRSMLVYFCATCFGPIREAWESVVQVPDWWCRLMRAPMTPKPVRRIPRPGPREIDALIAERNPNHESQ